MDLGANGLQTFRYVLFPELRSAFVAGAPAGLRAVVGRGHRHDLHRRRQHDDPDLDLDGPPHGRKRLRDQRGRGRRGRAEHRARLFRPAPDHRHGRRACRGRGPGHADGRGRRAVHLMAVRAACWALPAAALACLVTACGTSGSTADTSPAGPSAPASTLPRAEGTLRLLTRQGYAENTWVKPFERSTGCRVEVRYADSAESLRRAAERLLRSTSPRSRASIAYAVVQDGAARAAQPRSRAAARELPGALPRPGGGARRCPPLRRLLPLVAAPRALAQDDPQARARHLGAALVEHEGAARAACRSRTRRSRSATPRCPCASSSPRSGSPTPTRSTRPSSPRPSALTKRRMHLAGALWQLPGDEIDAFAGGLVDVGAGDWYTAARSATRTSTSASRCPARAHRARSTSGCWAPSALHPGCAYRWMRYASEARVQAQVARYFGATPVNRDACAALGRAACQALHADAPRRVAEAHRVPPHAGRELRRRPDLRAVRALGAGLEELRSS